MLPYKARPSGAIVVAAQGHFEVRTEGTTNTVISGQPTLPEPTLSMNTQGITYILAGENLINFSNDVYV